MHGMLFITIDLTCRVIVCFPCLFLVTISSCLFFFAFFPLPFIAVGVSFCARRQHAVHSQDVPGQPQSHHYPHQGLTLCPSSAPPRLHRRTSQTVPRCDSEGLAMFCVRLLHCPLHCLLECYDLTRGNFSKRTCNI